MDSLRDVRARVAFADLEERRARQQNENRAAQRLFWTLIAQYAILVAACIWIQREHLLQDAPGIRTVIFFYVAADIYQRYQTKCELTELRQKIKRLEDRDAGRNQAAIRPT